MPVLLVGVTHCDNINMSDRMRAMELIVSARAFAAIVSTEKRV